MDEHPDIYPDDPYGGSFKDDSFKKDKVSDDSPIEKMLARLTGGGGGNRPPSGEPDPEDEEDDGMLRMSFMDHLGELRSRIIRALVGFGVIFFLCLGFSNQLWLIVQGPAVEAFHRLTEQAAAVRRCEGQGNLCAARDGDDVSTVRGRDKGGDNA